MTKVSNRSRAPGKKTRCIKVGEASIHLDDETYRNLSELAALMQCGMRGAFRYVLQVASPTLLQLQREMGERYGELQRGRAAA